MRRRTLILLAAVVALAAVAWLGGMARSGSGPAAELLGARCVLGYVGAQATVTITGFGARDSCEASLDPFYVEDLQPTGGVVCRKTVGDLTYTVRDVGMTLVGSDICARIGTP